MSRNTDEWFCEDCWQWIPIGLIQRHRCLQKVEKARRKAINDWILQTPLYREAVAKELDVKDEIYSWKDDWIYRSKK